MKLTVNDFAKHFRTLVGDTTESTNDEFILTALNWGLNSLASEPKIGRIFKKHRQFNLDANGNYKWKLNDDFRDINNIEMLNFYTSTGGEPCKLNLCVKGNKEFFTVNGLIPMKKAGKPCQYTIERDGDDVYLVIDRPSNVPIIIDYIASGHHKPIKSMDEEIEIPAPVENLLLSAMRNIWYQEGDDFAFGGAVLDYADNKLIPVALQEIYHMNGNGPRTIMGEM